MDLRDILERMMDGRRQRQPMICAGVGSGVTAKGAVEGGADLLAVYNTAVYRIMGLPTALAFHLVTLGWVFDSSQAIAMAEAGAHLLGINLGLTTLGTNDPNRLNQAIRTLQEIVKAARSVRRDIFTLIHGGPFNDPETVAAALHATGADGYVTGSTAETTPVRASVADTIRRFRAGSTSSASAREE